MTEMIESMATPIDQLQRAQQLVEQARAEGVELIGPGGLLTLDCRELRLGGIRARTLGLHIGDVAGRCCLGGGTRPATFHRQRALPRPRHRRTAGRAL